jgi:hypothetical protein
MLRLSASVRYDENRKIFGGTKEDDTAETGRSPVLSDQAIMPSGLECASSKQTSHYRRALPTAVEVDKQTEAKHILFYCNLLIA